MACLHPLFMSVKTWNDSACHDRESVKNSMEHLIVKILDNHEIGTHLSKDV